MDSRKILVIPHQPHRGIRVRALEIARFLAEQGHQVSVLTWETAVPCRDDLLAKLCHKAAESLRSCQTVASVDADAATPNLFWIRMPYLLYPNGLCQWFNARQIGALLKRHGFDIVINASAYHFPVPASKARYLYDVVDDHLSPGSGTHWKTTRAFTLTECRKADRVLTISHALQSLLKAEGVPEPFLIPNGVDLSRCASVPEEKLEALRDRYHLQNRFVVAYVGNHGGWSGTGFLLSVFERFRQQVPDSVLLIVGPGEDAEKYRARYESEQVVFTGAVSPDEATAFFHVTNVGVLPFDLCPFTHHSLPLKILEYGAARKTVLASPLQELATLNLPYIHLLPLETDRWVDALVSISRHPPVWESDWDKCVAAYDWHKILQALPV